MDSGAADICMPGSPARRARTHVALTAIAPVPHPDDARRRLALARCQTCDLVLITGVMHETDGHERERHGHER